MNEHLEAIEQERARCVKIFSEMVQQKLIHDCHQGRIPSAQIQILTDMAASKFKAAAFEAYSAAAPQS